jgi:hypothetical protein
MKLKDLLEERENYEANDSPNNVELVIGHDYTTINGMAYKLTESGCNNIMGYRDGRHTLSVPKEKLNDAIEVLANSCDEVMGKIVERIKKKYLK